MSYSKFKLKNSGGVVYYEIETNGLYNELGESLSMPPEQDLSFYEEAKQFHGTRKKTNKPTAIRILLGHACNYSCDYCMQKDIGNPEELPANKNLQPFLWII